MDIVIGIVTETRITKLPLLKTQNGFSLAHRELTAEEQGELRKLWKKLVSLYHPGRFAHEPDKLATYEKLTAAINHAKDGGDLETLRQTAAKRMFY